MATGAAITIPDGYTLHTENTSHVLLPSTNEAFLNPIQEFNRDLSVACIRTWSEDLDKAKEAKWIQKQQKLSKDAAGSGRKRVKSRYFALKCCSFIDKIICQRAQRAQEK
jgi:tRNA (guanine26-N2/guanine27-N2)-dimethyltransferase